MTITGRLNRTFAHLDTRRAERAHRAALVQELATFRSPAERLEIEIMATRADGPDAQLVLGILDQQSWTETTTGRRVA